MRRGAGKSFGDARVLVRPLLRPTFTRAAVRKRSAASTTASAADDRGPDGLPASAATAACESCA